MTCIARAIAILFSLLLSIASAEENSPSAPTNPIPAPEEKPPSAPAKLAPALELNTILMQSTFRIHGPKKGSSDKTSFGTAFLMGKPTPDITKQYYVLITAAHVLEDID